MNRRKFFGLLGTASVGVAAAAVAAKIVDSKPALKATECNSGRTAFTWNGHPVLDAELLAMQSSWTYIARAIASHTCDVNGLMVRGVQVAHYFPKHMENGDSVHAEISALELAKAKA